MQRLSEIPIGEVVTGLFYGEAGTGKTWTLGTAGDRSLYCDLENRLATLQNKAFRSKYKFDPLLIQVHEAPIPSEGAKALSELTAKLNDALDNHIDEFDIILVDGATALRRFGLNAAFEINSHSRGKQLHNPKIEAIVGDFPYESIDVNDYQTEMDLILKFLVSMNETAKEYKKHFFMTAHERIDYNKGKLGEMPTINRIRPGFTGKTFPDSIPGQFDLVWRLEVVGNGDKAEYYARTEGDGKSTIKTCIGQFPSRYKNPNILDIIKNVRGG